MKRAILGIVLLTWASASFADGNVRMYKLNKKDQQIRIILRGDLDQAGCHNLLFRGKHVFRFAQTGFAWCSVYTESDCAQDSISSAFWDGKRYRRVEFDESKPQAKLYPGSDWKPQAGHGRIKSWYCEAN